MYSDEGRICFKPDVAGYSSFVKENLWQTKHLPCWKDGKSHSGASWFDLWDEYTVKHNLQHLCFPSWNRGLQAAQPSVTQHIFHLALASTQQTVDSFLAHHVPVFIKWKKKKNILLKFGVVMTFFYFNTTREKENKTKTFRHWKHFPWTCYIFLRLKMTAIIIVPDISSINILSATSSTAFQQHVVFWGIFINVQKIVVC